MRSFVVGFTMVAGMASAYAADPSSATGSGQPAPSAPPIATIKVAEGTITSSDVASANPPTIQVTNADGKVLTLRLDTAMTAVWEKGLKGSLSQLKQGQWVRVRYTEQDGKEIAKSIQIGHAAASASSTSQPSRPPAPASSPSSTPSSTKTY
ncbi:MAG: hypothetical protein HYZ92_01070 [Candidatus Omnitrophica bacterium]|nr:hypothetical protein [Candidatus Omnitrophota bacterium]